MSAYRWVDGVDAAINQLDLRSAQQHGRFRQVTLEDDTLYKAAKLGFYFPFMGTSYDSYELSSNGYIRLLNMSGLNMSDSKRPDRKCCPELKQTPHWIGDNVREQLAGPVIAFYYTDLDPSLRVPRFPESSTADGTGRKVSPKDGAVWVGGQPHTRRDDLQQHGCHAQDRSNAQSRQRRWSRQ